MEPTLKKGLLFKICVVKVISQSDLLKIPKQVMMLTVRVSLFKFFCPYSFTCMNLTSAAFCLDPDLRSILIEKTISKRESEVAV